MPVRQFGQDDLAAVSLDDLRFGNILDAVIGALDENLRLQQLYEISRRVVFEYDHQIDGFERGENRRPRGLPLDRPFRAL